MDGQSGRYMQPNSYGDVPENLPGESGGQENAAKLDRKRERYGLWSVCDLCVLDTVTGCRSE